MGINGRTCGKVCVPSPLHQEQTCGFSVYLFVLLLLFSLVCLTIHTLVAVNSELHLPLSPECGG